ASAVANAENNDGLDPEELYVSACFADEGVTMKRFKPRARGRPGRIRKRTCHITVVVSRMPDVQLARLRARQAAEQGARRSRRVAGSRAAASGDRDTTRRRRGGEEAVTAEPVAAAEAAGVVDPQAAEIEAQSNEAERSEASEVVDNASGEAAALGDDTAAAGGEEGTEGEAGAGSAGPAEAPESSAEQSEASEDE